MPLFVSSSQRYLLVGQFVSDHPGCTAREASNACNIPISIISPLFSAWVKTEHLEMNRNTESGSASYVLTLEGVECLELLKSGVSELSEKEMKRRKWESPTQMIKAAGKKYTRKTAELEEAPNKPQIEVQKPASAIQVDPSSVSEVTSAPRQAIQEEPPYISRGSQSFASELSELSELFADKIASLILGRVVSRVKDVLEEVAIGGGGVEDLIEALTPYDPSRAAKPRILVVGLLPAQKHLIQQEFSSDLDLRFAESNVIHKLLRQKMQGCEHTFLMTNFVSHSLDAVVSNSGASYQRVTGGMSVLRDAITDYFLNRQSKVANG